MVVLIVLQHVGGVTTLYSATQKNAQHRKFGFWVANLARAVVVGGWLLNGNETNIMYVSIISVVLFIASFYNTYLLKTASSEKANPESPTKKPKI